MRDRIEGTAGGAGQPKALGYLPATLAAVFAVAALVALPALTSWTRPWFYGLFLGAAGPPAPSRLTALITLDDPDRAGASGMDGAYVSAVAEAALALGPAVLALDLPSAVPEDFLAEAQGPLVLGSPFRSLARDAGESAPGGARPPVVARSLYPHLDGSGLRLPRGDGFDFPASTAPRAASGAFSGPFPGGGKLYAFPAFARLDRGVVAGLGVEAARRSLGVPASGVTWVDGVGALFDPTHILPVDGEGRLLLRFHGEGGIPAIQASRILDGAVRPEEIRGKTLILATPGHPPVPTVAGPLAPAEIWATAASNLLERGTVSSPSWGGILAVSLGAALALILLAIHFADLGLFATLLLAALLAALYPLLSLVLFVKSSWWLPPDLPPFLVFAAWLPFALARLLSPRPKPVAAAAIKPAPVYDPLVAMGGGARRPTPAPAPAPQAPASRPTPPRGIPQTPGPTVGVGAGAPGSFVPDASRPRPPVARGERQGPIPPAPAGAPSQPNQPHPPLPTDPARGQEAARGPDAAAAEAFRDPRDPPLVGGPASTPAPHAPPRPAVAPAPPVMPHAHTGNIVDDIERDAKGGLVRVGKYRIVRKMGFGSGGDVFEGFDTHMGRKVAIKTITKEAAAHFDRAAERFVVEAKAAGSLNHPCINTIYDFGTIREVSYMVLEYLDGITLSQWMRTNPVPHPRQVAPWVQQIASALDYAHSQKVIHRDLKPANLMVVHQGATIKLLDFGIAKLEDVGLTQTGMTVGTPSYMSPEQLTGSKVTPASDQYGLAVVLYQLYTYKLPYQGTKIPELCNRILKNEIIPISDLNPALGGSFWEVLRKAMSKAPEDRWPTCMALSQALEAASPAPQTTPA
jgi:hypothetical protein